MSNTIGTPVDMDLEWKTYDLLPPHWRRMIRELPMDVSSEEVYRWYKAGWTIGQYLAYTYGWLQIDMDLHWESIDRSWPDRVGVEVVKKRRRKWR